jgi:hypothetical protein
MSKARIFAFHRLIDKCVVLAERRILDMVLEGRDGAVADGDWITGIAHAAARSGLDPGATTQGPRPLLARYRIDASAVMSRVLEFLEMKAGQ